MDRPENAHAREDARVALEGVAGGWHHRRPDCLRSQSAITTGQARLVCAGVAYTRGMSEPKTKPTSQDLTDFLNSIDPEEKRRDGFTLLEMMQSVTGEKAVMWGPSIVGFGSYH